MKFTVAYSLEKDVNNYLNSVWKFSYLKHGRENIQNKLLSFLPDDFQKNILEAQDELAAREVVTSYLNNLSWGYKNPTQLIVLGLETLLNDKKEEIVGSLETAFGKPFPFEKITVYVTTISIQPCSYENLWFMAYRNNSIRGHLNVAKHELNHFMFYYYFSEYLAKKNIDIEKRARIKEALAILTNPEGNNKPEVKELEEYVKSLALEGRSVDQIVEACVSF